MPSVIGKKGSVKAMDDGELQARWAKLKEMSLTAR
jgi:hypothetical protein